MTAKKNSDETLMNLRIPKNLLEEFKQATKEQDETASQAIRKFIRQYVKTNKPNQTATV